MSMAALKGDTAFQARSLVSRILPMFLILHYIILSLYLADSHRLASFSTVPLPPPTILPVRRLQLPRVRQAEDEGRV